MIQELNEYTVKAEGATPFDSKREAGRYLHIMYKFSDWFSEPKVISVFGSFFRKMISIIYCLSSS
jgi:hypothetical protein